MYTHLKKHEERQGKKMYNLAKLICSFVNPGAAEDFFSAKTESVENTGFDADLKRLDPKFDISKYAEMLE